MLLRNVTPHPSSSSQLVAHSRAAAAAATAAINPPALLARFALESAEEEEVEVEVDVVLVPVAVPVPVAVASLAVEEDWTEAVALTVLVVEYWLARAQYWVIRPL